jgi:signal peptidase I
VVLPFSRGHKMETIFSIGDMVRLNKAKYGYDTEADYEDEGPYYGVVSYVNSADKEAYISICWLNLEYEDNKATYSPEYFEKVS